MFVAAIAFGAWYFTDTRTPEERGGQVSVDPGQ